MTKLTQHDGRAIHLASAAIAQVTEAERLVPCSTGASA